MNFDDMADQLSAHPDYKVKRRLVPILNFGQGTGGPTKRVLILDTETTGLDWRTERIIELAMLAVDVDMQTGMPVGQVRSTKTLKIQVVPSHPKLSNSPALPIKTSKVRH